MRELLVGYDLNPTTWFYISSLMIVGIFFKFGRIGSLRNLDLLGLIAFAPGLLLIAQKEAPLGHAWLFGVSLFFLLRLLLDTLVVRRPLLEPNLSAGGLTFTVVALLAFLTANVVTGKVDPQPPVDLSIHGPGFGPFYELAGYAAPPSIDDPQGRSQRAMLEAAARSSSILGHLFVVLGLVLVGYRHYDNIQTGMAAAALYLLLPYTSDITRQVTNCVDHVVPGALLIWAIQCYRRPVFSGLLVGAAAGLVFFPLFLLPLWGAFYVRRGLVRFLVGFVAALAVLAAALVLVSADAHDYVRQLQQMFGWHTFKPTQMLGFWEHCEWAFRIPVIAAFVAMSVSFALWPAQKNLGTLLSCSAAVMVAAQFWHPINGGIYMGWYLPLLVMTIFRPNLEDRVALTTVRDATLKWRGVRPATAPASM